MIEIHACPFCGSNEVECRNISRFVEPIFAVICQECEARGPTNMHLHDSDVTMKDEAIIAWNRVR